jgi:hypothetical protein
VQHDFGGPAVHPQLGDLPHCDPVPEIAREVIGEDLQHAGPTIRLDIALVGRPDLQV